MMSKNFCAAAPVLTSLIRIGAGYLLLVHGTAKLLGIPHIVAFEHLRITSLLGVAGIFELICGGLILLGLFTRPAAFVASGFTAAAYLVGHFLPLGKFFLPILTGGEGAILFSFVFFLLFLNGPGPLSLDALVRRNGA